MNIGITVRHALNKAELPIDADHLQVAKLEYNDIVQDYWYMVKARFRFGRGTIVGVSGSEEYILPKNFDAFVKHTVQSDTIRYEYKEPEEFFRLIRLWQGTTGEAYIYTFGDFSGVDNQLTSGARIRAVSSLSNKTSGVIDITAGSAKVTSDTDIFSLNDVGLHLRKDGDSDTYEIARFVNTKEIHLAQKYRGQTGRDVAYAIGDLNVHVNITGYVGGQLDSEDLLLNGSTAVVTTKTFATLVSISKSGFTGGYISVANEANTRTVGTLAPAEMEIERQTVLFWPQPTSSETVYFRYFLKHPLVWLDSERCLLPEKYHRLIRYRLEKALRQWSGQEVPSELDERIVVGTQQFLDDAEDITLTDTVPQRDGRNKFGDAFVYDKDEDFYT